MTQEPYFSLPATEAERKIIRAISAKHAELNSAYSCLSFVQGDMAEMCIESDIDHIYFKIERLEAALIEVRQRRALFDRHASALRSVKFKKNP